jgi:hypothetical protein
LAAAFTAALAGVDGAGFAATIGFLTTGLALATGVFAVDLTAGLAATVLGAVGFFATGFAAGGAAGAVTGSGAVVGFVMKFSLIFGETIKTV